MVPHPKTLDIHPLNHDYTSAVFPAEFCAAGWSTICTRHSHDYCASKLFNLMLKLEKGVPELRGPAFVCLSALEKNWPHIF